jgi:hypothetical protein
MSDRAPQGGRRRRIPLPLLATGAAAFVIGAYAGVLLLGRPSLTTARSDVQVTAPADPSAGEPEEAEASSPSPSASEAGVHVIENYTFSDVQVVNDGLGDFSIRAELTNNGPARNGALFTASIFESGAVVGTVSAAVPAIDQGETMTVTLNGLSDFTTTWDELRFQVDAEF